MPDLIYLYKDSQKTDLYGQFPLVDVTVQFPQEQSPSPHCFLLNSSHPPFLLTLSALDEKQYSQWLFQIDWRVKALQVVRKDRENESDSLTSVEDALVTKKEWLTKPPRKVQNSLTKERPRKQWYQRRVLFFFFFFFFFFWGSGEPSYHLFIF
eukprot:TRINITY_DN4445_c0_g1_i8.p3 TRINITY_DN4445_c0_g1~~TRINITY_DN4445_c0_g1_i8.p3  ORF type:complete len:153 (-),score=32.11 TRINITY_DN4445_c0_g1_i8:2444-2902(-)